MIKKTISLHTDEYICIHLCLSFCIGMASAVVSLGNLCTTNLTSTSYTYQAKRENQTMVDKWKTVYWDFILFHKLS